MTTAQPAKSSSRVFERAQGFDVEIVGRFVEQQHVAARLQHLGQVDAVALAARQLADVLLLVAALEVERADIGAGAASRACRAGSCPGPPEISSQTFFFGVERVAALVDIAEEHGLADPDRAGVGLFLAGDQAEQRRLARAVRTDDADDAARRAA